MMRGFFRDCADSPASRVLPIVPCGAIVVKRAAAVLEFPSMINACMSTLKNNTQTPSESVAPDAIYQLERRHIN